MFTQNNLGEQRGLAAADWTTGCLGRMISVCGEMGVEPKLPAAVLPLGSRTRQMAPSHTWDKLGGKP